MGLGWCKECPRFGFIYILSVPTPKHNCTCSHLFQVYPKDGKLGWSICPSFVPLAVKMGNIVQFIGVELLGRFLAEAADK